MKSRRTPCLIVVVLAAGLLVTESACSLTHPQHQPGEVHGAAAETNPGMVGKRPNARGLSVEIKAVPDPLKLGETREISVTLVLRNNSKETQNLKFATSQLIEILLRDPVTGNVVTQWSTDHTFSPESRYLVINPRERLEYNQPIATRDLKPGKPYNLEGYFVGYDQELRATKVVIAQP